MKKIKQKTRKGVTRRFKITATGKVLRRTQNMRHHRSNKSKRARRSYRSYKEVTGKMATKIKRMMGVA